MKNKYQRMSKEERAKVRNRYYKTEVGMAQRKRLIRLFIIGIIGIAFSIYLVVDAYLKGNVSVWTWIVAVIVTIFSLVYIASSIVLRGKSLNLFAVKNGHI